MAGWLPVAVLACEGLAHAPHSIPLFVASSNGHVNS